MSDTQAIKVLIADDEPGMRLILRKMIARVEGYELVGEAQDGEQLIALFEQNRPQVAEVATQGEEALKCLAELACPAFRRGGTAEAPVVSVDESQCSGCMVCLQVTPAIRARKRS